MSQAETERGTAIVWGMLAAMPFGGMIWQVFHYMEGLRRLGFDVWYVEDSENPCMHPETWERVGYYDATVGFLEEVTSYFGFQDRWIFRPPGMEQTCLGAMDLNGLYKLYEDVDVVFNLCGANRVRPEHETIRRLVMLQTDPVVPQIANARGNQNSIDYHARHGYHFTYAENIGQPYCLIPKDQFDWIPTRPPVVTDWWKPDAPPSKPERLTTIANWDTRGKDVEWNGELLRWSKTEAFEELIALPRRSSLKLELSLSRVDAEKKRELEQNGWIVTDAMKLSKGTAYRDYIRSSVGEFTTSKGQYVRTQSGWFSDRSVCYLAAGRPVITQDTGFGAVIPTGTGLFSYSNEDEAIEAIDSLHRDYDKHADAALEIAKNYFEAETVLQEVIRHIGLA